MNHIHKRILNTNPLHIAWIFCMVGLLALPFVPASCRSTNVWATPAQVETTVHLRGDVLAKAQTQFEAGQLDDAALVQILQDEEAAWAYLRAEAGGFSAQDDFKKVLQTQEVGVRVARTKVAAGEYQPEEKLELLRTLGKAWASLRTYYDPLPDQS